MPRADAQRNYERLLVVAREVVEEQGTQASLRDVARRAGVGLGTLYRHFPTRDALLETLLRRGFERLTARAEALSADLPPQEALTAWLGDFVSGASAFRGLPASMLSTLTDKSSPLYASCRAMHEAGSRLLAEAQAGGHIRQDVDGTDLFALVNAVGWIAEQTEQLKGRRDHLLTLVLAGLKA